MDYIYTIYVTGRLPDSWVHTALRLVFHSGLTGLETSWAICLIAEWLSFLPSSAWLKLYFRAFSWTDPSLKSCLIACPRCSLLGKLQPEVSTSAGPTWRSLNHLTESMDSVPCWLSWTMSQWILSPVDWAWLWVNEYWALLVELECCPNGGHISLTPPVLLWRAQSCIRHPSS